MDAPTANENANEHPRDNGGSTGAGQPQKRKPGGQPGNTAALRHGLFSVRSPVGCTYIDKCAQRYRRELEAAVLEARGEIGVLEASKIQTAVEAVRHAARAQHWLRVAWSELTWQERLAFDREASKALEARDRCLASLGIERGRQDAFDRALDAVVHSSAPKPEGDA